MKLILISLLVVLAIANNDKALFAKFKHDFHKVYGVSEEQARFAIFRQNLRVAEKLNAESTDAVFGVTKFMDLTADEFREKYLNLNLESHRNWIKTLEAQTLPPNHDDIDWRTKSNPKKTVAVSKVKDQAQCGSCWAFSAAGALEGCAMIKNGGVEVNSSPQQIVDCCFEGGSAGCGGGYPDQCLNWATQRDIATWNSYPYHAYQGTCQAVTEVAVPANTCQYYSVTSGYEPNIQDALAVAPVSICLDAGVLQTYSSGIITGSACSGSYVDHAVLLVAWVDDVYSVKNSWGLNWGEKGFFRMQANVDCLSVTREFTSYASPK